VQVNSPTSQAQVGELRANSNRLEPAQILILLRDTAVYLRTIHRARVDRESATRARRAPGAPPTRGLGGLIQELARDVSRSCELARSVNCMDWFEGRF
jgi:hypothetical protein